MQTTHFEFFDLFELPVSLKVDKAAVQKKFYLLSRQFHPDHFTLSSIEEQEKAIHTTATINKAKKVLDDAYLRLEYILKEKALIEEEEKYQLPMDFLSDMMELNEEKMEWMMNEEEEAKTKWLKKIETISSEIHAPIAPYFEAEKLDLMNADWTMLKDFYYKRKYLERMMR